MDSKTSKIIQNLLDAMDMQEKRETGEFHIPQESALAVWNESKQKAKDLLNEGKNAEGITVVPYQRELYCHFPNNIKKKDLSERIQHALGIAIQSAQVDGGHHKMHCIDQMVRALTGCEIIQQQATDYKKQPYIYHTMGESQEYKTFVRDHNIGENEEHVNEPYSWDTGIPG